jgi:hypothetical protein
MPLQFKFYRNKLAGNNGYPAGLFKGYKRWSTAGPSTREVEIYMEEHDGTYEG